MKGKLRFKLFGQPKVYKKDVEIRFSYLKIEALLYYVAVMGEVNRDEIAGLLWADKNNQVARKNLRNTVYQANKILGADYLISPSRSSLALNPQYQVEVDVDVFVSDPLNKLAVYQGDFLEGFYVKDDSEYENWVMKKRLAFRQLYIDSSYQKLEEPELDRSDVEHLLMRLIDLDEFEEKNYQLLLLHYQQEEQFGKFFETYYSLVDLLDRELGVRPNDAIESLYQVVLKERRAERYHTSSKSRRLGFWGRKEEMAVLEDFLSSIEEGRDPGRLLLLQGDFGAGKHRLLHQALLGRRYAFQTVKVDCQAEKNRSDLSLSLVESLMRREEMSSFETTDPLFHLLQGTAGLPLLLIFEQIDLLEEASILFLERLLDQALSERVSVILSFRQKLPAKLASLLAKLRVEEGVVELDLNGFTDQDSLGLIRRELGDIVPEALQSMLVWSQGNLFFLTEYIRFYQENARFDPLPPAIRSYLSECWVGLEGQESELLFVLSCFRKAVPFRLLLDLLELDRVSLSQLVDRLVESRILEVREEHDHLLIQFHQKVLGEFAYQSLTLTKKRILHQQIALKLEEQLKEHGQLSLHKEIAYQYKQSKENLQSLTYELNYLEGILQFHQELFPIYYKGRDGMERSGGYRTVDILDQLSYIRHELGELQAHHQREKEFRLLRMRFLYLEGRYYIRLGDYQKGIHAIQQVIQMAKELDRLDYLLEAYRQMIYYCIQTENLSELDYYSDLALEDSVRANNHEAIALHLRLRGVYFLIKGDEEQATRHFYQSLDCFSLTRSLQQHYPIQIAAALDYLAEIEQIRGNYTVALAHQEEALQLVQRENMESIAIVFEIGRGISHYLMGDFKRSKEVLDQAHHVLSRLSFPWKEAQLELYLALLALEEKNEEKLRSFLAKKEHLMNRYGNPRDRGLVNYFLALLAFKKQRNEGDFPSLLEEVTGDFSAYAKVARQYLNPYRDKYFVEELDAMEIDLKSR
ncbi:BTAD domain-containing putative transcriptional regulator [Streptococcus sp. DD13]|uniref:BTAD domain-containing putative transcriptional regulator n=1 Tax=Streptococcus sp. DD13 TaxID=1777881 RepID=UPI00079CA1C0|nr:BTAD domain-containing putative transcriptional regulator [Streptococcus sp. DD13]KXT78055.1 Transcriptional regulator, LuxR family [Streptococcus sp. DD13]